MFLKAGVSLFNHPLFNSTLSAYLVLLRVLIPPSLYSDAKLKAASVLLSRAVARANIYGLTKFSRARSILLLLARSKLKPVFVGIRTVEKGNKKITTTAKKETWTSDEVRRNKDITDLRSKGSCGYIKSRVRQC